MAIVKAQENVKTMVGTASVIQSDTPFDTTGVGGCACVRVEDDVSGKKKVFVHTTGDYRPDALHIGLTRGWQVALNKDQALCLARELIKMAREL
jgi:hypothetical protein